MSNEKFQNKYRIKSARAMWHDYGGGAYFITVCTKTGEHSFGEITSGKTDINTTQPTMLLTPIGQFLTEIIQNTTDHCPYVEIPLFVVMPNHWHAIVFIDGDKTPYLRRNSDCTNDEIPHAVETRHATSLLKRAQETRHATSLRCNPTASCILPEKNHRMQNIANKQGWLSVAIGGIKSAVTKFANENNIDFAWQMRFNDRIIRDRNEFNRIADYIENNPALWDADCFNKNKK